MEQFTKYVTGQSYGQLATATAGRVRLDAPYVYHFVVQTLGPTMWLVEILACRIAISTLNLLPFTTPALRLSHRAKP